MKLKHEAQSAHFSGRQHTLHCCVLHDQDLAENNPINQFIYHLSDDTNHNNIMTVSIIEDILKQYPQILSPGHIVICSDNCSTHYKSCFTFVVMMQLAKKYGVTFTWFYGEPGHGRGLVDAMSSFGCKGPLKHAIITKDQWFSTAEEMSDFLKKFFNGDSTKHYHVIHEKDTAELRKAEKNEHKIAGSMKLHMVSVDSAFHPSEVDKMSTRNFWELSGKK